MAHFGEMQGGDGAFMRTPPNPDFIRLVVNGIIAAEAGQVNEGTC